MHCKHCGDTGYHRPADGPSEICTCVDAWAREKLATGTVADLIGDDSPNETLTGEFQETLPGDVEWDGHCVQVPGLGNFVPDLKPPLWKVLEVARVLLAVRDGSDSKAALEAAMAIRKQRHFPGLKGFGKFDERRRVADREEVA